MMSRLFASVQKSVQVGVFFLLSHRTYSPLFMRVGVRVGVENRLTLRWFASSRLSGEGVQRVGRDPGALYCLNVSPMKRKF